MPLYMLPTTVLRSRVVRVHVTFSSSACVTVTGAKIQRASDMASYPWTISNLGALFHLHRYLK